MRGIWTEKKSDLSEIGAEIIPIHLKPDKRIDQRPVISSHKVASLLKTV